GWFVRLEQPDALAPQAGQMRHNLAQRRVVVRVHIAKRDVEQRRADDDARNRAERLFEQLQKRQVGRNDQRGVYALRREERSRCGGRGGLIRHKWDKTNITRLASEHLARDRQDLTKIALGEEARVLLDTD